MNRLLILAVFVGIVSSASPLSAQETISVDMAQEGITFDGFGGFGAMNVWWSNGPFYNDEFWNLVFDSLRFSIIRTELYPLPDQTQMFTKQIPYLKAAVQEARARGIPLTYFASVWTPPASMKTNNNTAGGTLKETSRQEYAEYLIDYVNMWQDSIGHPLYAVSPQNEPALGTGYNSCPYTPAQFSEMFKVVAAQFKASNTPCWLSYSDNIAWTAADWHGQTVDKITADPVADSVGSIMSGHYSNFGDVAGNIGYFGALQQMAAGTYRRVLDPGKRVKLWNTECGGQFDSWQEDLVDELGKTPGGAWTLATDYFQALAHDFTAMIYWQMCEAPQADPAYRHYTIFFYNNGEFILGPRFQVMKTFSRFIQPGAIKVGTSSPNDSIWSIAYKHPQSETATILLMNRTGVETSVSIAGSGLPETLDVYQTSPTQDCEHVATISSSQSLSLPVKSVTVLTNVSAVTGTREHQRSYAWPIAGHVARHAAYDLRGRKIDMHGTVNAATRRLTGVRVIEADQGARLELGTGAVKR